MYKTESCSIETSFQQSLRHKSFLLGNFDFCVDKNFQHQFIESKICLGKMNMPVWLCWFVCVSLLFFHKLSNIESILRFMNKMRASVIH